MTASTELWVCEQRLVTRIEVTLTEFAQDLHLCRISTAKTCAEQRADIQAARL